MSNPALNDQRENFTAKLNKKYSICTVLLAGLSAFGWYGIYFLNANTILMEDNTPMSNNIKFLLTFFLTAVIFSWTTSLFMLLRQMILRKAFCLDKNGIHDTMTAGIVLAFIFIVPVKQIPYSAIQNIEETSEIIILSLDRSQVSIIPFFRPFMRRKYHFFNGFTTAKTEEIKKYLPVRDVSQN